MKKFIGRGRIVFPKSGPNRYYIGDKEVTQEEYDAAFPPKPIGETLAGHSPACWPQTMEALAVHPAQVDQANARAKAHGIDAIYQHGTGLVQVGSRADRAKLIRLEGGYDRSGGYSDG